MNGDLWVPLCCSYLDVFCIGNKEGIFGWSWCWYCYWWSCWDVFASENGWSFMFIVCWRYLVVFYIGIIKGYFLKNLMLIWMLIGEWECCGCLVVFYMAIIKGYFGNNWSGSWSWSCLWDASLLELFGCILYRNYKGLFLENIDLDLDLDLGSGMCFSLFFSVVFSMLFV